MPWSGYSDKWYNLLEARERVQAEREESGITFDFDLMEYVDADGGIVASEDVAAMDREAMAERGYTL